MDKNIKLREDLIEEFSKFANVTKSSSKYFFDALEGFMSEAIENQTEVRFPGFTLYYSEMKPRTTTKVGTKEIVNLPATRKARLKLSPTLRRKQTEQSKVFREVLNDMYEEDSEEE